MKSQERQIAEKVQELAKKSLVIINAEAMELVNMGLVQSRLEALEYMLQLYTEMPEEA